MNSNDKSYTVCVTQNGRDLPLSKPIKDPERAALAWNMLHYMSVKGAEFTVNGEQIHDAKNRLCIMSKESEHSTAYYAPDIHNEWYEPQEGERFTLCMLSPDYRLIHFAPETKDWNEANDMFNFMHYGVNESVGIAYIQDGKPYYLFEYGGPNNISMTNENGEIRTERNERDWCDAEPDDFTEAVNKLSTDAGLEL